MVALKLLIMLLLTPHIKGAPMHHEQEYDRGKGDDYNLEVTQRIRSPYVSKNYVLPTLCVDIPKFPGIGYLSLPTHTCISDASVYSRFTLPFTFPGHPDHTITSLVTLISAIIPASNTAPGRLDDVSSATKDQSSMSTQLVHASVSSVRAIEISTTQAAALKKGLSSTKPTNVPMLSSSTPLLGSSLLKSSSGLTTVSPLYSSTAAISSTQFTKSKTTTSLTSLKTSLYSALSSSSSVTSSHLAAASSGVSGPLTSSTKTSSISSMPTVSTSKRGLAYNDASLVGPFAASKKIGWAYNWYTSSNGLSPSIDFVPMFWGPGSDASAASAAIYAGAKSLLTYNEPDETSNYGGSATSPQQAAIDWSQQLFPFVGHVALGSPAVTSYNTTNGPLGASGLEWLRQFVNTLGGSSSTGISFVSLHWYGNSQFDGATQAAAFQGYITQANAEITRIFGRQMPIWVTEFSSLPIGNQQIAIDFMNVALPFLDSYTPVVRYAFFMDSTGNLVNNKTSLTQAGSRYNS